MDALRLELVIVTRVRRGEANRTENRLSWHRTLDWGLRDDMDSEEPDGSRMGRGFP